MITVNTWTKAGRLVFTAVKVGNCYKLTHTDLVLRSVEAVRQYIIYTYHPDLIIMSQHNANRD